MYFFSDSIFVFINIFLDIHQYSLFMNRPLSETHKIFAQKMGCNESNVAKGNMVECLREKSVGELMTEIDMFDEYNSKY